VGELTKRLEALAMKLSAFICLLGFLFSSMMVL
jgi:hypothetical protein